MAEDGDPPRIGPNVPARSRNINNGNVIRSLSMPWIVSAADSRGE
jgi:hypothetical protein